MLVLFQVLPTKRCYLQQPNARHLLSVHSALKLLLRCWPLVVEDWLPLSL